MLSSHTNESVQKSKRVFWFFWCSLFLLFSSSRQVVCISATMISVLPGGPRALPEDVSEMIVYSLAANAGPFALLLFRGTHRSWRLVLQQALDNQKNLLDLAVPSIHELANVSDSSDLPLDSSLLRRIGLRVCDNRNDSAVNRYCIYDRQIDLTNIDQCRQYFRQWHLGSGVEVVSDNVQRVDVYGRVLPRL